MTEETQTKGTEPMQPGKDESLENAKGSKASPHDHDHSAVAASRSRIAAALSVTALVMVAELVGAWLTGSLALAADAGHMAVDSSGLVIALIAAHLMMKPRSNKYTWGMARAEVLAAALQAGMLLIICVVVAFEGIKRLAAPPELTPLPMLVVGSIGLVANIISLLILMGHREASLNMRAAFLEVANDALGSVAVIVAAVLALTTGWMGGDAVASLFIAALMAPRAVKLLKKAMAVLMEQTPGELDLDKVREHILSQDNVLDVHDLHISTISTGTYSLTAHICIPQGLTDEQRLAILHALEDCAAEHFPIELKHTTYQFDSVEHVGHERLIH